jgi:fluoroquinolone resistance protein
LGQSIHCDADVTDTDGFDKKDPMSAERLLAESQFDDQTFSGFALAAADLAGKEFYRCVFERCQLPESTWSRAKLEACTFRDADLSRAKLSQTALHGVRFEGCKVMGVDFSKVSTHPDVGFTDCLLRYASFSGLNLRKTTFTRCSLREVNLIDLDLTDASFGGCDLAGATLRGCTLLRTDFRATTGLFFEPARNKVKQTFVPIEVAVQLAQSQGLLVEGYDAEPTRR